MAEFRCNTLGLNQLQVGALRAIVEAFEANVFEDANRNLRRLMFDAAQAYGKDRSGGHRAYDQSDILRAMALIRLGDEYQLLERLPALKAAGALEYPKDSPMPVNPLLDVAI